MHSWHLFKSVLRSPLGGSGLEINRGKFGQVEVGEEPIPLSTLACSKTWTWKIRKGETRLRWFEVWTFSFIYFDFFVIKLHVETQESEVLKFPTQVENEYTVSIFFSCVFRDQKPGGWRLEAPWKKNSLAMVRMLLKPPGLWSSKKKTPEDSHQIGNAVTWWSHFRTCSALKSSWK